MTAKSNVGLVNFVTNSPYGSIYKFCPTQDYIDRLKNGRLKYCSYYSDDGMHSTYSEAREYNEHLYEMTTYEDYFEDGYGLNVIGYINQESNLYLVSNFLNYGLTFVVLNFSYAMEPPLILSTVGKYVKIIKKRSPNAKIALMLRYPETNRWCILCTEPEKPVQSIKEKYPELVDVIVHPFSYTAEYDLTCETFSNIQDVIKKFYSDKSRFVGFDAKEQDVSNMLLYGKTFGKKSAFSEKTIRLVCKEFGIDYKSFADRLVRCGILSHFPGDVINQYYFKNECGEDKIIPVLMGIFNNATYMKKTADYRSPARHFITPYLFRKMMSPKFKDRIPMGDRLILKILKSLKAGRTTLSGKKVYLRRYDIGEFAKIKSNSIETGTRFIYD